MLNYAKKILSYLSPYKGRIIILLLCSLVTIGGNFYIPILQSEIVDDGLINRNFDILVSRSCLFMIIIIIIGIVELILERNRLYMYNTMNYDLQRKSFEHLLTVKLDFFNNRNSTAINNMISHDVSAICTFIGPEAFTVITGFLSSFSAAGALFSMNWKLGIAILAFIPINLALSLRITKVNRRYAMKYLRKADEYNNWFGDAVNGIKEIRLFGIQKQKLSQINEKQDGLVDLSVRRGFITKLNEQIEIVLFNALSIALYIAGGYFMIKGGLTIGEVLAFVTFSSMVSTPIVYGIKMLMRVILLTPNIKRHFEFMEYEDEVDGSVAIKSDGDIEFKDVHFSYDSNTPLINNLNLIIKRGSKVALLGKNGVGKTTTLNILLRFLSIDSGNVLMSGHDISEYEITSYRSMFTVVSQEVFLFNDTILNNICLYNEFSTELIDKVIKLVNLDELIDERGLDYNVGINGSKLSGGQKQKVALARALIFNTPIIILDEATSNLDLDTISVVKDLIVTELKDRTVICVTHTKEISELFDVHINL